MSPAHLGRAVLPAGAACTGATAIGAGTSPALLDAVPACLSRLSVGLPLLLARAAHPITQQRLGRVRPAILRKGQAQVTSIAASSSPPGCNVPHCKWDRPIQGTTDCRQLLPARVHLEPTGVKQKLCRQLSSTGCGHMQADQAFVSPKKW